MQAKYIEFNGEWHKDCPCGKYYAANSLENLSSFFRKDKNRVDGLDALCKVCRKTYELKNKERLLKKWKEYYAPGTDNRKRHIVRAQTRNKYGSAKNYQCSICKSEAQEWHHITYNIDDVIAVCEKCHSNIK